MDKLKYSLIKPMFYSTKKDKEIHSTKKPMFINNAKHFVANFNSVVICFQLSFWLTLLYPIGRVALETMTA
jgi:hypothetical protein